jgi:hypothetical protein
MVWREKKSNGKDIVKVVDGGHGRTIDTVIRAVKQNSSF